MHEALLAKKKPKFGSATGIAIEGYSGTPTQSAGTTKNGDSYSFNNNAVNWLRIAYAGTPSPAGENVEVICRFIVEAIGGARLNLFSRYIQGNDPPSWMVSIESDLSVRLYYNNTYQASTGANKIKLNVEQKLAFIRQGNVYSIYLNDVLIVTLNYAGYRAANWDWVFGSYLNSSNSVILGTYAFPCKWTLLGFSAKRI